MDKKLLGFIGIGNMGGALARAAAAGIDPGQIVLANRTQERAEVLARELGCLAASLEDTARCARFLFLGVKPNAMGDLMRQIVPILRARHDRFVLVSMAAGVPIARIRQLANGDYPVVRICPNTPVAIGRGLVTWCAEGAWAEEMDELKDAMAGAGLWDECREELMDAASVVGGCVPAFTFLFLEALADGGVCCGLSREQALTYAAAAVEGAAALALRGEEHPGALKDAVCSPGGSTIMGVNELENRAFRAAAMNAVTAAWKRTAELGR